MRELLKNDLSSLKLSILEAEKAVYIAYSHLRNTERVLVETEDKVVMGKLDGVSIDGKNAEIRAAQVREATAKQRSEVFTAEGFLEAKKLELSNLKTELRITLALVGLTKGVA